MTQVQRRVEDFGVVVEDDSSVEIVTFDDEVHLYEPGDETAAIVYMTAVGANLDAFRTVVTGEQWHQRVIPVLGETVQVHDWRHRESVESGRMHG